MPRPITDQIAAVEEKRDRLAARLKNLQSKARHEDRARDTRRKIVVGGSVLLAMEKDPELAARIAAILAQTVGRPIDRAVIVDLLPLPAPIEAAGAEAAE